jgi:L-ascorbate metabolism protein UlaG (beta-lactamase superfamily)
MKKLAFSLVCTFMIQQLCHADTIYNTKITEVTYIANEGFLIKVNDKKILIDALFEDPQYSLCDASDEEILSSMAKSEGKFKDIDLIAATHRHIDHFYAPLVLEHLKHNKSGKFISCKQSIGILKKLENYDTIKYQVVEITPDTLSYVDTTINDIKVRVYRISHSPYFETDPKTGKKKNRHQNIQNLGFLFNIDGVKIFHGGDSNPYAFKDYAHFRLDKENIDIAFLSRGFMWESDSPGIDILRNHIKAKQIILMHIYHNEKEKIIKVAKELKSEFPNVKIFENKMETFGLFEE